MHGKSAKVSAVDTPFSSEMNCNLYKGKLFIFKTVYALSETPRFENETNDLVMCKFLCPTWTPHFMMTSLCCCTHQLVVAFQCVPSSLIMMSAFIKYMRTNLNFLNASILCSTA